MAVSIRSFVLVRNKNERHIEEQIESTIFTSEFLIQSVYHLRANVVSSKNTYSSNRRRTRIHHHLVKDSKETHSDPSRSVYETVCSASINCVEAREGIISNEEREKSENKRKNARNRCHSN